MTSFRAKYRRTMPPGEIGGAGAASLPPARGGRDGRLTGDAYWASFSVVSMSTAPMFQYPRHVTGM